MSKSVSNQKPLKDKKVRPRRITSLAQPCNPARNLTSKSIRTSVPQDPPAAQQCVAAPSVKRVLRITTQSRKGFFHKTVNFLQKFPDPPRTCPFLRFFEIFCRKNGGFRPHFRRYSLSPAILKNGTEVGHARSAHIEHHPERWILELHVTCVAGKLLRGKHMH